MPDPEQNQNAQNSAPAEALHDLELPVWASGLREVAGKLHAYLVTEPKHEALRIVHEDLGRALRAWDAAIMDGEKKAQEDAQADAGA